MRTKPRSIHYSTTNLGKPGLDAAVGNIAGVTTVNKYGTAIAGIQTTATDLWDRADATPTQQIWLAPTAARIHTIASTSVNDTTSGTGANSVKIYYLADWDSKEETETVTGNLNGGIAMTNAAVMIHRMVVIPQSTSTTINAGTITATAAIDSTVTAQINIGYGQTEMAIYGIPSTQKLMLSKWYGSIHKSSGVAAHANFRLLYNPAPDTNTVVYLSKETQGLQSTGTNNTSWEYEEPKVFTGPGILKVQATSSANDLEGAGGFNGTLIDI